MSGFNTYRNLKNGTFTIKAFLFLVGILICFSSCENEVAIPVTADFNITVLNNDYSVPVQVGISNITDGADTYHWSFEGGTPSSSLSKNPGTIVYNQAGNYTIRLEASNRDESNDIKEIEISLGAELVVNFNTSIIANNFPPMEVELNNTTIGAETYSWTFQGANISSSNAQNPANIIFNEPGEHTIILEASNGLESFQTEQTVNVAPHLEAIFNYEIAFQDDDLQVPVTLTMQNNSISALNYNWTINGVIPTNNTEENPSFTLTTPGTYTINLETTNGKETQTTTQEITVLANTNIRTFQNIQLGINTAHNNNVIGAFFSTKNRETYTQNQVTLENGADIDIAFFGLNQNFSFNKFIAADEVQSVNFNPIPNATHTKFINSLASCACAATMSVADFDAITDDTQFAALTIEETTPGLQAFNDTTLPRIVLFETQNGRKGAIKINDFVVDGQNSYILIDIKVQKEPN